MSKSRIIILLIVAGLIAGYFIFDLGQYFSLEYFKSQQAAIDDYFQSNPLKTALVFFAIYVAVTGLSLLGAALMTLVAGAIFRT